MAAPNQRGLASADDLRLDPLPLKPSDLVLDLPKPLVRLPTHHYTDARFFRQVQYVYDLVGSIIHISGSLHPETEGALHFSNVYALYEVSHWPGAERQLTWTNWTLRTIAAAINYQPVLPCPPAARAMLSRCIREGLLGRYSYLFELFPDLQVYIESVPFARSLGRKPATSVVDGDLNGSLQICRITHATGMPECRADTALITTPLDPALKGKIWTGCDERPVYIWICPEDSITSIKSQAVRVIREATATKRKLPWGLGDVKLALHDVSVAPNGTATSNGEKKKQEPCYGFAIRKADSEVAARASKAHPDDANDQQNQSDVLEPLWQIPNRPLTQDAATTGPVPVDTAAIDTNDLEELDDLLARTFGHTAWTATATSIAHTRPSPSRTPPKTPTPAPLVVPGTDSTIALLSSSTSSSVATPRPPTSPVVLAPRLRPGRAEYAVEEMRAARRERLDHDRDLGRGSDTREQIHAQMSDHVERQGLSQIQARGQGQNIPSQQGVQGRGHARAQIHTHERSPSQIPRDQAPPPTFGEVEGRARKKRKVLQGYAAGDAAAAFGAATAVAAGVGVGVMSEQEVRRAVGAARIGVDAGVLDPALFESEK